MVIWGWRRKKVGLSLSFSLMADLPACPFTGLHDGRLSAWRTQPTSPSMSQRVYVLGVEYVAMV